MPAPYPEPDDALTEALEADDDGQAVLAEIERQARAERDRRYPEPTQGDIMAYYDRFRRTWSQWRDTVDDFRDLRYQRDDTPAKWKRNLRDGRRFHSRMAQNEINRRVSSQYRAQPQVTIASSGEGKASRKRQQKEQRWANRLIQWLDRGSIKQRYRNIDALYDCGKSALEIYLTDAYDDIDTEPRTYEDPRTGEVRTETAREVRKRTESQMRGRRPIGWRWLDGRTFDVERDEQGDRCRAIVVERKPYAQVAQALRNRGIEIEEREKLRQLANNAAWSWPEDVGTDEGDTVLTMRYYDRRWYCYIVEGQIKDGPREHGLPGVPVIDAFGRVTSASNLADAIEGALWGMEGQELAVNDMMTLALDVAYTYSRPRFAVKTAPDGMVPESGDGKPPMLDLSNENGVPFLPPGAEVVNVLQGFEPMLQMPLLSLLMSFWQRGAVNPVAQGQAPGANAAGYTVAALTANAEEIDYPEVAAEQAQLGDVVDFVRRMVRDTIKDTVYLLSPLRDDDPNGQAEWLGLGPEDVSEASAEVIVDAQAENNKLAKRQSLIEGHRGGYVSKRRVQTQGYQIEDTEAEDREIAVEQGWQRLLPWIVEQAMAAVGAALQPEDTGPPSGGAPQGDAIDPSAMRAMGGAPAPVNPPTVGAQQAAASRGPLPDQAAYAGQGNGYVPPNVRQ